MKLKYNLIAWSLLGFFAAACDPMDDIYNEIDAEGTTNTQTMAEYVLTDADYETISSAAAMLWLTEYTDSSCQARPVSQNQIR